MQFCLEIKTCDPLNYTMDHSKFIAWEKPAAHAKLYCYFMFVCSIVTTITPRCPRRPDALLHEAEGRVQEVHQVVNSTEG